MTEKSDIASSEVIARELTGPESFLSLRFEGVTLTDVTLTNYDNWDASLSRLNAETKELITALKEECAISLLEIKKNVLRFEHDSNRTSIRSSAVIALDAKLVEYAPPPRFRALTFGRR